MIFILTMLLAPLVAMLGSDRFDTRQAAQNTLERLSLIAWPALEKAKLSTDPEVAYRAQAAQERCWTPWKLVSSLTIKQPGWCSPEMAAWYAADESRWSRLGTMAASVGGYWPGSPVQVVAEGEPLRTETAKPWVSTGLTDKQFMAAIINHSRSKWRGDGILEWSHTWLTWANPGHMAMGPDLPIGP